ncbi:endonuclease 8 [Pseudoscourfieldia marina]
MSGRFKTFATDAEPETTATTRLRLIAEDNSIGGHLSAMTVKHGGIDLFESKMAELGPDPLREDADANRFFDKLESSRFKAKPVGLALMDQNTVAGIGNIYRAEILFRAGIHPEEPCGNLTREQLQTIWNESVVCLKRGFETGSILTVDPKEGLPEPWTRRYIYNHKSCGRCGGAVKSWDMANRTAYACAGTCQPLLIKGGVSALPEARQKAFKAAKQHTSFVSHCAPEPKPTKKKAAEAAAAAAAVQEAEPSEDVDDAIGAIKMPQTPASRALVTSTAETPPQKAGKQLQKPGTSRGRRMVGPADAAQEKERAGEKKNVEHVALEDGMDEGRTTSNARRSKRARKL